MKHKKLKELAKQIALAELKLESAKTDEERNNAEEEIIKLTGSIHDLTTLMQIDSIIQDFLLKEKNI